MKTSLGKLAAIVTLLFFMMSCSKSNDTSNSTLHIRLTDAPGDYDAVNIDLKEVRIKINGDSSDAGWQTLQTNAGVYNLLAYRNGDDTLVAKGLVGAKNIKQVRLILGDNNTIVVDSVTYPLTIPSGSESGLKIMFNKDITQPLETVTLDFDALLSIKEENGNYKLRPVIKVK